MLPIVSMTKPIFYYQNNYVQILTVFSRLFLELLVAGWLNFLALFPDVCNRMHQQILLLNISLPAVKCSFLLLFFWQIPFLFPFNFFNLFLSILS
jgi:hypothetical protein